MSKKRPPYSLRAARPAWGHVWGMINMGLYVQYGCGLSAPQQWVNFDSSPTLRVQKTPVLGRLLRKQLNVVFPANVNYGDIRRGLPAIAEAACTGVYCSHILEHLALDDFRQALRQTYRILKPGGIFRCVVPDLASAARRYVQDLAAQNPAGSLNFFETTLLGMTSRPQGLRGLLSEMWGGSRHLYMWDAFSLTQELAHAGFRQIRECTFHDSPDEMFRLVEEPDRFTDAVALEAIK